MTKTTRIALLLAALGTALSLYVALVKSPHGSGDVGFFLAVMVSPWAVLGGLFLWPKWPAGLLIAAALMLALEAACFLDVFVFPRGSADGLVYIVKPFLQVLVLIPVGMLCGWLAGKARPAKTSAGPGPR